jgi:hypothetical protein
MLAILTAEVDVSTLGLHGHGCNEARDQEGRCADGQCSAVGRGAKVNDL